MKLLTSTTLIIAAIISPIVVYAQDLTPDLLNAVLNVQVLNERGTVNAGDTITFTSASTGKV